MGAFTSKPNNNQDQPLLTEEERLAARRADEVDTEMVVIVARPNKLHQAQDMLGEISLYLPLKSFLVFRTVCRQFLEGTKRPEKMNGEFLRVFFENIFKQFSITSRNQLVLHTRDSFSDERYSWTIDINPDKVSTIPTARNNIISWVTSNNKDAIEFMKAISDAMEKFVIPPNKLSECMMCLGNARKKQPMLFLFGAILGSAGFFLGLFFAFSLKMPEKIFVPMLNICTILLLFLIIAECISRKMGAYQQDSNGHGHLDPRLIQFIAAVRLLKDIIPSLSSHEPSAAEEPNRGPLLQ